MLVFFLLSAFFPLLLAFQTKFSALKLNQIKSNCGQAFVNMLACSTAIYTKDKEKKKRKFMKQNEKMWKFYTVTNWWIWKGEKYLQFYLSSTTQEKKYF